MADATVWHDIFIISQKVTRHFGLKRKLRFEPILAFTCARMDGDCLKSSGLIRLRVHRITKGKDGTWKRSNRGAVARSTIMASLGHELAHLRIDDHGPKFREFTLEIANFIRSLGEPVSRKIHGPSFGPSHYNKSKKRSRK